MLDSSRDVRFVSAKRTAFGAFGGACKDLRATDLGACAASAALAQGGVARAEIDEFSVGTLAAVEVRGRKEVVQTVDRHQLGRALGASDARVVTHLLHEPHRRKSRYQVGTAWVGGGQGVAVIVESLL